MMPLSTMSPVADDSLKEHERALFWTFLSVLADETEASDVVILLLWTDPAGRAIALAATGLPAPEPTEAMIRFGNETMRWVHEHHRPLVLDNGVGVLGRLQEVLDRASLRSAAIFPLLHRERPAGALVMGRRTGPSPFAFVDLTLVTLFGHLLSTVFERLRLFEWMQANVACWQADPMSREDSPPPKRTGSVHPPGIPSAALPDEPGFIHGIERMYRCVLWKNQSDPVVRQFVP